MKRSAVAQWAALFLLPLLVSCATYRNSLQRYHESLNRQQYEQASRQLDKNRLLKKERNKLLYYMEAGKLKRLQGDHAASNQYLNLADNYLEAKSKSLKDVAVSNLINPMSQSYRGEDYEQFMLHYYKALNYVALGKIEDAVVEARRITLSNNRQNDKFRNEERYNADAFAMNLQGMIYEMAGDINNAFIAYRNAANLYQKNRDGYYGVTMPVQLEQDLQRTAKRMGFISEVASYTSFNPDNNVDTSGGGSIILFIEEGQAPIKKEKNFLLTNTGNGSRFTYINENGNEVSIPFFYDRYAINENRLSAIKTVRVAVPTFGIATSTPANKTIMSNGKNYEPELAENINVLATNILQERWATELANAAARQITKMAVQKAATALTETIASISKDKADSTATAEQKEDANQKNNEKAKVIGQAAGFVFNAINTLTEKADTRNWQSLPAFISYVRIPLQRGENILILQTNAGQKEFKIIGNGRLQLLGVNL